MRLIPLEVIELSASPPLCDLFADYILGLVGSSFFGVFVHYYDLNSLCRLENNSM